MITARKKLNKKQMAVMIIKYVVLCLLACYFLFRYVYMINMSLMDIVDINSPDKPFFPTRGLHFENFAVIADYIVNFKNSLVVALMNAVFIPFTSCLCAYPLARRNFHGRKTVFTIMLLTCLIPGSVLQIPTYVLYTQLGLIDNLAALYINSFFGGGFMNIFLIMQFARGIPRDIESAAQIDGAGIFRIFFTIVFPLCFNVLLYIGISSFIAYWSDFQGPLVYLASKEKFTAAVAFYYDFLSQSDSTLMAHKQMAVALLMTIVPAVLYFVFQKRMIGGIQIGAIK